ncbi:MAG: TrkH family potassium uptake protein [Candidatus Methanomethyliaceae archaeon]|nr:TrkH family potassium uptake protein [Candidatus Methanomethyliaceae archaeon]MDW7970557.1 TrkH family potassium uptake protein [Nitrososphaerota archaeon]
MENETISGLAGLLIVFGIVMLIPILFSLIYEEYYNLIFFIIPAIIFITIGLYLSNKYPLSETISTKSAIIIASSGWLLVSAIGAIPYLSIGMGPLDAFFESISGFTTTGMTLINSMEEVPKSIIFWRSLTQWVGGIGIVFLFTIFLRGGIGTWRLYTIEGKEKFTPSIKESIREIMIIYLILTSICAIILFFCGLSPFESINHAMTTLATGGFSTRTNSVADFSNIVKIVIILFMIAGAIDFTIYYELKKLKFRKLMNDAELRLFLLMILASCLIVSLFIMREKGLEYALDGIFNVVSIATTTGFTSFELMEFSDQVKALILLLMLIGGCAGSTAGGLKVWRLIVLFGLLKRELQKLTLPFSAVLPVKIGERALDDDYVMKVGAFFFTYIITIFIIFLLLSFTISDKFGALSLAISSVANVGPAFYSITALDSYSKIVLIIGMWLGRLEIIPILVLMSEIGSKLRESL